MARVLTNNVTLAVAVESSIGTLPGSPKWFTLEPNSIGAYGAAIETTPRAPISKQRGRKKGAVTNKTSSVDFESDLTVDGFTPFIEGFVFAQFANVEFDLKASSGTVAPPVASSTTFTIDAASATLAGKIQWVTGAQATLIWATGYTNAANNGLHVLTADVATTNTTITVGGSSLVTETPPANASLQVAGVRCAASDLAFTVSGSTATLVSAGDISDWSTLGLFAGMYIHFGSPDTDGTVQNALGTGTDIYGYARITSIDGATVNLDKLSSTLATDSSNAAATDIMFGRFLRNVDVDAAATDNSYLERSFQFEAAYPDLGGVGTPQYEYAVGNFANELSVNMGLNDKTTMSIGFVGTNSDDITSTRKTNASSAVSPLRTTAFNTTSDFAALTTDVISSASDVCFKNLTFTIGNGITPENCLGTLGAVYVNTGNFEVGIEGEMLFTNASIVNAIKNNTTVTFSAILRNDNGAIAIDIPAMTFGDGARGFPVGESVTVSITGSSFNDPTGTIPDVSLGITIFPAVPYA